MSNLFDFLSNVLGGGTDRPIQVDSDNNLFVEEQKGSDSDPVHRPYQGFTSYGSTEDDSMDNDSDTQ